MSVWREGIKRAADIVGGIKALERAAGLPRNSLVFSLTRRVKPPSAEIAIAVSRATGGEVKIADIIPHVAQAVIDEVSRTRRQRRPRRSPAQ